MTSINELAIASGKIAISLDGAAADLVKVRASRNAWGIIKDPTRLRRDIGTALAQLRAAQDVLDKTKWPTDADYEALEIRHNRGEQ